MGKRLTHDQYVRKLKGINSLIVLENYINSKTQILHKCECGNEWKIEPERAAKPNTKCRKCGIANRRYNTPTGNALGARKITKDEHDSRLTNGITRVEDYNGMGTPIKYQCSCGNVWQNKPMNMIYGNTPTCPECHRNKLSEANIFSHAEYIKELNNHNISIAPIEHYKGRNKKILHMCECGTEYNTLPVRVLLGNKCLSCGQESKRRPHNRNKPEVLYYLRIGELYKIGICRVINDDAAYSIKRRYGSFSEYDIIYSEILDSVGTAFSIEQQILKEYEHKLYSGVPILKDGNSELFTENIFQKNNIQKYIEEIRCSL